MRFLRPTHILVFCFSVFLSPTIALGLQIKAIYGEDTRRDFDRSSDQNWIAIARSIGVWISEDHLLHEDLNSTVFKTTSLKKTYDLCPEERFKEQPSLSFCTGVLISPRRVLTAGHCLESRKCPDARFVFGFENHEGRTKSISFDSDNVFRCHRVLERRVPKKWDEPDFAIIELDRSVNTREPLDLDPSGPQGSHLHMIGSPLGIPLKISEGSLLEHHSSGGYLGELDAFEGNSGSPIFDSHSHKIVGILTAGEEDFEKDRSRKCLKSFQCSHDRSCDGEYITSIHSILKLSQPSFR